MRTVVNFSICLNPCFNGTYSRRSFTLSISAMNFVLILVLMEHTLGDRRQRPSHF